MNPNLQAVAHLGRFERLQLVQDLWDEFAAETSMENRPDVLDELERRAAGRDQQAEPGQSLTQLAQTLGVRL